MPLIKVYNIDSDLYGLKGHSIFKSVCNIEASWRGTFGHLIQTASAESRFFLEDLRRRSIDPTDCKENGPWAIWLIEFWCLVINTIRELISFSSVYVCSSQDAWITWTKELGKATPQKKTLKRSKKSPSVLPADCLCVEHRTVRCPHTGLSGAPGNSSPMASSKWHPERRQPDCPVWSPDCTVWKAYGANGHLLWQGNG
jgi:hypothetical protein